MLTLRLENGTVIEGYYDHEETINTEAMLMAIFEGETGYYTGDYLDGEAYDLIACMDDRESDDYERIVKATWADKNKPVDNKFVKYVIKDMNKIGIGAAVGIHKVGILEHGHDLMWDGYCYKILSQYAKSIETVIMEVEAKLGTTHILRQCFDDGFNFPNLIQMCYEFVLYEQFYDFALEDL